MARPETGRSRTGGCRYRAASRRTGARRRGLACESRARFAGPFITGRRAEPRCHLFGAGHGNAGCRHARSAHDCSDGVAFVAVDRRSGGTARVRATLRPARTRLDRR